MFIKKWNKFIPQQFVAVGKDMHCITFQCTNQEADQIMQFVETDCERKVWVVACQTSGNNATGWMQAANGICVYSVSFEDRVDYDKFLEKFDD